MTANREWLAVDRAGLALQVEGRPAPWVLYEVLANSLDAPGVKNISILLTPLTGVPQARLVVTDDAPGGVERLDDLWTLFAPSTSAPHAQRRGRFCLGEKLILALAIEAEIVSTTGGVRFDAEGRHRLRRRLESGTTMSVTLRLTREQVAEIHAASRLLLPPPGVSVTYNAITLESRAPVATTTAKLLTETSDATGVLRRRVRETTIGVYEPLVESGSWLYELGIPVVPVGDRYSYDIAQKVPLNRDRDNVPAPFLADVRAAALSVTYDQIKGKEANSEAWVRDALPKADPDAVKSVFVQRFGAGAVAYDPSDPEASAAAMAEGRTVVPGGALSSAEWAARGRAGALPKASDVIQIRRVEASPDGVPPVPREKWTPGMVGFAERVEALGAALLGRSITVEYYCDLKVGNGCCAWFGFQVLTFNLGRLGKAFCDNRLADETTLSLVIHELAHHYCSNHLSDKYHEACCNLGARCARLALQRPELFK